MPRIHSSPLLLVVGLLALLLAVWASTVLLKPPAPDGAGDFEASRAFAVLERLAGPELPHPVGTAENAAVRDRLVEEFLELGYDTQVQSVLACREIWAVCGFVHNVIARLPGTAGRPAVLMSAHYDSVGAGPGIADDLAGAAALLEVARLERDAEPTNPLLFVISDGEEVGLLGAEGFTRHEAFKDVAVVVNVEARGTSGQSLLFETGGDNAWLVSAFAREAGTPVTSSLYHELYRTLPNDTDFSVYREAGLTGLNFAAIGGAHHYHTPLDNLDNLSLATLQHHGDNLLAAARALSAADLTSPPPGDAVFTTTVPGTVQQLPTGWAFYLALATLVFWFVASARLLSTGQVTALSMLSGAAFTLVAVLLAATLGQAVSWLLPRLSGQLAPWWAEPQWTFGAIAAAALTGVLVSGMVGARRSGFWGMALGYWFWFALASFLLVEYLPGASVVFLLPATVIAFLLGFLALSTLRGWPVALGMAVCVSLFAAGATWLPLAWNLQQALGLELGAGIAACLAFACLGLLPLLALPAKQRLLPPLLALGSLVTSITFIALALRAPVFTEQAPQFVDILHFELADESESVQSSWLLDTVPILPLPERLAADLDLESGLATPLPWSGWAFHAALAPPAIDAFPSVTLLDTAAGRLRIRLDSPRGGNQIHLFVPAEAGLQQIAVSGTDYVLDYSAGAGGGFAQFSCHGTECSGLQLELVLEASGPVSVLIADQTPGLPDGGAALQAARGNLAVPWQDGDVTLAVNRQVLNP